MIYVVHDPGDSKFEAGSVVMAALQLRLSQPGTLVRASVEGGRPCLEPQSRELGWDRFDAFISTLSNQV